MRGRLVQGRRSRRENSIELRPDLMGLLSFCGQSQIGPIPRSEIGDFPESRSLSTAARWLDAQPLRNVSRRSSGEWMGRLSAMNALQTGSTFPRFHRQALPPVWLPGSEDLSGSKSHAAFAASRGTSFVTKAELRTSTRINRARLNWACSGADRRHQGPRAILGRAAHLARYPCRTAAGPQARAHAVRLRPRQERISLWALRAGFDVSRY